MGGSATTLIAAAHRVGFLHTAVGILQPTPLDDRDLVFRGEATECANGFVHVTGTTTNAGGDIVAVANAIGKIVARDARSPRAKQVERKLLTVLFTDIVGSTQAATELGDDRWQELLAEHHRIMRDQLAIFDGHEVKTTGDGFLLTFESPAQAIAFAASVRLSLQRIGVKITAGIHTGECELSDDDIAGIAVNTAARVMGAAQPDEILVTGVVCDLVAGSSHSFSERGTHELKGIDRPQQLFQVDA
jgi:class 3 adenylate cyclase